MPGKVHCRCLLMLTLLLQAGWLSAQSYEVTRYADDNGLPSRIVLDVIQDSKGFIWVGGNNGLYRFDGQHFIPYLSALKDTIGLRDNKINTLLETSDGNLYIGTPKGLHVMRSGTINYIPLKADANDSEEFIISIFEDRSNGIWISTYGGIFQIGHSEQPLQLLADENSKESVAKGTVWSITQDDQGVLWAATNDGLYKNTVAAELDFKKAEVILDVDLIGYNIGYYKIQQIRPDLFMIDTSHGLLKGTINNGNLLVSKFKNADGEVTAFGYSIQKSVQDAKGDIWLATWKASIKKFKLTDDRLTSLDIITKNGFQELSGIDHSVFEDRQGNIWFANTNGLYKFSVNKTEISNFPPFDCLVDFKGIYAMVLDSYDQVWVTTPTALYRFDKKDLLENNCPDDYLKLEVPGMEQVRNLFIDTENRLWLGSDGGLFITQLNGMQHPGPFIRYTTAEGLPHNHCYEIHQESEDSFWIGNDHGLIRMTLESGNLNKPSFEVLAADEKRVNGLVNSQAMEIEEDTEGALWVGTFSGLSRMLDPSGNGRFANYSSSFGAPLALSNNSIKKVLKDSRGNLWVATQRGLNLYRPDSDDFLQFGHDEGLPSEYVLGLAEDSKEQLWIGTTNGVLKAKFDVPEQRLIPINHYTVQDGLKDNIPYRNAMFIDKGDNVFIGSRDGISMFSGYERANHDAHAVAITLTDVQVLQDKNEGFVSMSERLDNHEISLSYLCNSLKINYVILDFTNPDNNKYRHKLLPVNESWIETGSNSELSYYNLSPGDYEFVLDASNTGDRWTENPIRLKLTIRPPFWKSHWAFILYILLFAALLRLSYLIRVRKKEHEMRRKCSSNEKSWRNVNYCDAKMQLISMMSWVRWSLRSLCF